jgi:hypothetical protein
VGQPDCSWIVKGEMRAEDGDNEKNSEGAETVRVVSSQRVVSETIPPKTTRTRMLEDGEGGATLLASTLSLSSQR